VRCLLHAISWHIHGKEAEWIGADAYISDISAHVNI
jgi:hypothetical protein